MVFDIGVTDMNADGILDIFTADCFSSPNLLFGDGHGRYRQMRTALGLDHTPEVPGFGASDVPPDTFRPGLYMYIVDRSIVVQAVNVDDKTIRGSVAIPGTEHVTLAEGVTYDVTDITDPSGLNLRHVAFSFESNGRLVVKPTPLIADPIILELDESVPLEQVYLGADCVPAPARRVTIAIQDVHSYAWADIDANGHADAFIGRGAMLSGEDLEPRIDELEDRLLVWRDGVYEDIARDAGLHQRPAPSVRYKMQGFCSFVGKITSSDSSGPGTAAPSSIRSKASLTSPAGLTVNG